MLNIYRFFGMHTRLILCEVGSSESEGLLTEGQTFCFQTPHDRSPGGTSFSLPVGLTFRPPPHITSLVLLRLVEVEVFPRFLAPNRFDRSISRSKTCPSEKSDESNIHNRQTIISSLPSTLPPYWFYSAPRTYISQIYCLAE